MIHNRKGGKGLPQVALCGAKGSQLSARGAPTTCPLCLELAKASVREWQRVYRSWLRSHGLTCRKTPFVTKTPIKEPCRAEWCHRAEFHNEHPAPSPESLARMREQKRRFSRKRTADGWNAKNQRRWKARRLAAGLVRIRFGGVERWVKAIPGGVKNTRAQLLEMRRRARAKAK